MTFRADLHVHTTYSDGTNTPKEVIEMAVAQGLSGLSITDHDTVAAYEEAVPLAQLAGIKLVVGIELSSRHEGEAVHILGYHVDLSSGSLTTLIERHKTRRIDRNRGILDRLAKRGMAVSEEEVVAVGQHVYGRPHIAQVMVDRGYVTDVRDAFNRWIGDGKPCFVAGDEITTQETIEVIHQAGGKAVIAHPAFIRSRKVVRQLLEMPFDGIEGYYAQLPKSEENKWIRKGLERGWIVTGGSDFHGEIKPNRIGCSWVCEDTFNKLLA